ncbi:MAG: cupin domain-containing protein [Gaiellaceae bacterium]
MLERPLVVQPGEGEVLADTPARSSRIKVARDELLLLESTSAAGERGAAPHIHREHADAFYVLEGELGFHVAGEQRRLPAGSFVLAPPGLVHGFEIGPAGARYLNLHAPGARYAALSRARRDGVEYDASEGDSFPPSADGGRPASDALVSLPSEGERLPEIARFLLKGAQPELALLEFDVEPGFGSSPHVHRQHHDTYYVLAGEIAFGLEAETVRGTEGAFVSVPPGVVHVWTNTGSGRARFLNVHTPGTWFERYVRERAEIETGGGEPDRAFFERHDIFVVD